MTVPEMGGCDGVVLQDLLSALKGELRVLEGEGGVLQGGLRGGAAQRDQLIPAGDPAAH